MSRKAEAVLHNVDVPPHHRTPISEVDRQAIRAQLARILVSLPFSTSKRYPALLSHVVERTLEGHTDELKERTLGIEVFHRNPRYDTNDDPVVRVAAGEVRKRLAQYYYESAHAPEIHIELPPGSYVPEFRPAAEGPAAHEPIPLLHHPRVSAVEGAGGRSTLIVEPLANRRIPSRSRFLVPTLCLLAGLLLGAVGVEFYRPVSSAPITAIDEFWRPLLNAPGSVWLCMGQVYVARVELDPNGARNRFDSPYQLTPDSRRIPMSNLADSITLARVTGLLQSRNKGYSIHGETETTFSDLTNSPSVLIGAYDNDWTIRLSDQLRFHFEMDANEREQWIADRQKPGERIGPHAYGRTSPDTRDAYAIISRVRDPGTGQMVMSLAGVSTNGTRAAGIFISEPQYLEDFAKRAPANWERANLQIVIAADIVDGSLGRPRVISSYVW